MGFDTKYVNERNKGLQIYKFVASSDCCEFTTSFFIWSIWKRFGKVSFTLGLHIHQTLRYFGVWKNIKMCIIFKILINQRWVYEDNPMNCFSFELELWSKKFSWKFTLGSLHLAWTNRSIKSKEEELIGSYIIHSYSLFSIFHPKVEISIDIVINLTSHGT